MGSGLTSLQPIVSLESLALRVWLSLGVFPVSVSSFSISLGRHGRPLVAATEEPLPRGVRWGGSGQSWPGVGVRALGWVRGQGALGKPVLAAQRIGAQSAGSEAAAAGAQAAGT